jgi:acetyltransferase-like isoleucine patch superfamily enzyme
MTRARRIVARLRTMDFHDYVHHAGIVCARWWTAAWYARFFGAIGKGTWLRKPSQIHSPRNIFLGKGVRIEAGSVLYSVIRSADVDYTGTIHVGDRTFMNKDCNLTAAFRIDLGCDVAFGPNVFVCDFDHGYQQPGVNRLATPLVSKGPISIGDRCWIGANSCISSGVVLGDDCVVGANSVVTRSFPAGTVVAGAPAIAIRRRDESTGQWLRVQG